MPVTGSISRTAVNASSGVKTQLGGLITGLLVLLSLAFMTPYCAYIPLSTLAAVVISVIIFSFEYKVARSIWRVRSIAYDATELCLVVVCICIKNVIEVDMIPWLVTFILSLFWSWAYGITLGILADFVIMISHQAKPKVTTYRRVSRLLLTVFLQCEPFTIWVGLPRPFFNVPTFWHLLARLQKKYPV